MQGKCPSSACCQKPQRVAAPAAAHCAQSRSRFTQAISIIARTLAAFDDDGLIPGYGFGDSKLEESNCLFALLLHVGVWRMQTLRCPRLHCFALSACSLLTATTADQAVFSFFPGDQPACGLDALVMRYKVSAAAASLTPGTPLIAICTH